MQASHWTNLHANIIIVFISDNLLVVHSYSLSNFDALVRKFLFSLLWTPDAAMQSPILLLDDGSPLNLIDSMGFDLIFGI